MNAHANNPNAFSNNDPNGDTFGSLLSAPVRVQIPAYTDRWMMGDRYGEIVKIVTQRTRLGARQAALPKTRFAETREVAHVKLDKSGKTIRVILDDCTEV